MEELNFKETEVELTSSESEVVAKSSGKKSNNSGGKKPSVVNQPDNKEGVSGNQLTEKEQLIEKVVSAIFASPHVVAKDEVVIRRDYTGRNAIDELKKRVREAVGS
jgi:hypothetical protein